MEGSKTYDIFGCIYHGRFNSKKREEYMPLFCKLYVYKKPLLVDFVAYIFSIFFIFFIFIF